MTTTEALSHYALFLLWLWGMYPVAKYMQVVKIVHPDMAKGVANGIMIIACVFWPLLIPFWIILDHKYEKEHKNANSDKHD